MTVTAQLLFYPNMRLPLPLFWDTEDSDLAMPAIHTAEDTNSSLPSILILTPVKDMKRRTLRRYLKNLEAFDYPRHLISVGILEGDSSDNSYGRLKKELPNMRKLYGRVDLFKYDLKKKTHLDIRGGSEVRHDIMFQKQRRSVLAKVRNYLLSKALRDEEWVLWVDADVSITNRPSFFCTYTHTHTHILFVLL